MELTATVIVAPEHPSLADHFPGNPIVPGVVMLEHITQRLSQAVNEPIVLTAIKKIRFVRPLSGGQTATVNFHVKDQQVRFTLADADGPIASGEFSVTPAPSRSTGKPHA